MGSGRGQFLAFELQKLGTKHEAGGTCGRSEPVVFSLEETAISRLREGEERGRAGKRQWGLLRQMGMVTDEAGDLRAEELCALTQVEPGRQRVSWGPRPCVSQEGRVGGHEGAGKGSGRRARDDRGLPVTVTELDFRTGGRCSQDL